MVPPGEIEWVLGVLGLICAVLLAAILRGIRHDRGRSIVDPTSSAIDERARCIRILTEMREDASRKLTECVVTRPDPSMVGPHCGAAHALGLAIRAIRGGEG